MSINLVNIIMSLLLSAPTSVSAQSSTDTVLSQGKEISIHSEEYKLGMAVISELTMIGTTNRMFQLDNGVYAVGPLSDNCSGKCPAPKFGNAKKPMKACALVQCKYLAQVKWSKFGYAFETLNGEKVSKGCGCSPSRMVACARRVGAKKGSLDQNWGYDIDVDGRVHPCWDAPMPPLTPEEKIDKEFSRCYRNSEGDHAGECARNSERKRKELSQPGKP